MARSKAAMKPVPKSILINTGDQEKSGIQEIIDNFFIDARDEWVKRNPSLEKSYLEIKAENHESSDNRTTYLTHGEGRPFAVVMETRTEFNRINYTFFKNI
jgi:hypothetical protein